MTLGEWRQSAIGGLKAIDAFPESPIRNVTLLAYFFYNDERIHTQFHTIEFSILSAYRACGRLPTVLVVNRKTDEMSIFAATHGIEIQEEASLSGGLASMNLDCDGKLHSRFNTDYVLVVESDGIMVNSGLEKFVGKYDYIGAPWKKNPVPWYFRPFKDYLVGNSGFCLRSKAICEEAARLYRMFFRFIPYNWFLIEDIFYCKTLRWFFPSFRRRFKFPDVNEAGRFSIEMASEHLSSRPPVGFHGEDGFRNYVKRFGIPF